MEGYILDWANLLLRWLHVITAIAWIGSSFYFVWLDNTLTRPTATDLKDKGVDGELWAVHGGGFYNPQKYLLAPKQLPDHLHWFYWESYSTWMSGFALLTVVYLFNANVYMIDRSVFDMTATTAVLLALGFLVVGWLVYDTLCRVLAKEGAEHNVTANVVCPGFVRTPLVEKQIPEQAKELNISEADVIKHVMLKDTVDGEFTTTDDVADAVLFFAGARSNALTGQSMVVSHGWFMQ